MKKRILQSCLFFYFLFSGTLLFSNSDEYKSSLTVSLKTGTVNDLTPKSSVRNIKKKLPMYTGCTEEKNFINYGGGVFFTDDDVYFYTYLDMINIRENYTGEIDVPVFHKNLSQIMEEFGNSYRKVNTKTFEELYEYKQPYGYLYFYFEDDVCTEIFMTSRDIEKCEIEYRKLVPENQS